MEGLRGHSFWFQPPFNKLINMMEFHRRAPEQCMTIDYRGGGIIEYDYTVISSTVQGMLVSMIDYILITLSRSNISVDKVIARLQ